MPGKKGFGDTRKKSSDTPMYKMKGNPMQRNFGIGSPSPVRQTPWEKYQAWRKSRQEKHGGTIKDIVERDISKVREQIKTGVSKAHENIQSQIGRTVSDVESLVTDIKTKKPVGTTKIKKAKSKPGKHTKVKPGDLPKSKTKTVTTDYSKMKSVNALVKDRENWRKNNPGKKYPGQSEINKRLKKNPNKWD